MLDLRQVGIRQSQAELMTFHVDGTGTAAITEGKYLGTLTDHGTGDYTITFLRPGYRECMVVGAVPETPDLVPEVIKAAGSVRVAWTTAAAGTPTDCNFDITVLVFYRAEQN